MPTGNPLSRFIQAIRGFLPGTRRNRRTVAGRNESVRAGVRRGTASASGRAPSPRERNKPSEPNTRQNSGPNNQPARPNLGFRPQPTRRAPGIPLYGGPVRLNRRRYVNSRNRRRPPRTLPRSEPTMENLARMSPNELQRIMNEL